jgi:adenine-specific DNA-methyltransferase
MEALEFVRVNRKQRFDLYYLDPPYNNRQYASDYHILETISRWDIHTFNPVGKTGRRPTFQRSIFSSKPNAAKGMNQLLSLLNTRYVVLSYGGYGIIPIDRLIYLVGQHFASVRVESTEYKQFQSHTNNQQSKLITEYAIIGEK